jgi:MFS family permease
MAQLFNLVSERIDTGAAAAALSTLAFSSVVGRLAGGVIVTRVSTQGLTAALIAVQAAALAMLAMADTTVGLIVASAIFGLSVGNVLMLQPLLLAETFGVKEYSRIYSFSQLVATIGVASGPFVLGVLRDLFDYEIAFLVAGAVNLVGLALLFMAGPMAEAIRVWQPAGSGTWPAERHTSSARTASSMPRWKVG